MAARSPSPVASSRPSADVRRDAGHAVVIALLLLGITGVLAATVSTQFGNVDDVRARHRLRQSAKDIDGFLKASVSCQTTVNLNTAPCGADAAAQLYAEDGTAIVNLGGRDFGRYQLTALCTSQSQRYVVKAARGNRPEAQLPKPTVVPCD